MLIKQRQSPPPELVAGRHPLEKFLRTERLPHIWCPGCGIGIALSAFFYALEELRWDPDSVAVVSGIGCTGRVAGYVRLDSYHTTHGRAIPFATGLKLAKPDMHVVVFSGDGDLFAIGGNHFIHAARRNVDITVICINNFNYGMTGGQVGPTTPTGARCTTAPYGNFEHPFNLVYLAASAGATYVARWTTFHARRLQHALVEALSHKGFTFVEVVSPCPTNFGRRNGLGEALDEMEYYKEHAIIRHGADPGEAELIPGQDFIVGKFLQRDKPTCRELFRKQFERLREGK